MKYVLVEQGTDNICDKSEFNSLKEAEEYFKGIKRMPEEKDFHKLWKVLSEKDWNTQIHLASRQNKQYEWWKDDEGWLDIDK